MFSFFKKKQEPVAVPPVVIEPPEQRTNDEGVLQEKHILPQLGEVWVAIPQEN